MGERLKMLTFVAILGFIGGVIADLAARYVIPAILALFPEILSAEWILSGIAGSVLTLLFVTIWAYISEPRPEA